MMTHGSLFAGIGGFDLGFEWAGIETLWQVEIDEYCLKVLAKHWPDVERFKDIKDCGKHNLKEVDIISGGFPCQDISVAGKQAGIDGSRSGLWSEMHRIIGELRPRYAVVENVPNLIRLGLERVLTDLTEIGYDAEWQAIGADDVGAPHRRERFFLVAYPRNNIGGCIFDRKYDVPYNKKWDATKNIKSVEGWKCWLNEVSENVDGEISKTYFYGMDDGVPKGLDADKIRGLGSAIVPQIAEIIGRRLKALQ